MQARAACKGHALQTEAAPYFAEYVQRKRLAKLGYFSPLSELSAMKAEIFGMIDVEIEKCQAEEARAKRGGRK
jgi:hypothetical protein